MHCAAGLRLVYALRCVVQISLYLVTLQTTGVTPANVAVLSPFLRPALTTAVSPCIAAGLAASMANNCSRSARAATSEGTHAMAGKNLPNRVFCTLKLKKLTLQRRAA